MLTEEQKSYESKIEQQIERLNQLAIKLEEEQLQKQKNEIFKDLEIKLNNYNINLLVPKLKIFLGHYFHYGESNSLYLIKDTFVDFFSDKDLMNYCKEEVYEKIINFFSSKIKELPEEEILEVISNLFSTESITEKDKVKFLVNNGTLDKATVFDEEKINNFKNELINFFNILIKYELNLIEKKEYNDKSSYSFYKILRFEDIKENYNLFKLSEYEINKLSYTEENAEKIKKEIKEWMKGNEYAKKVKMNIIQNDLGEDLVNYAYLFDEEELNAYIPKALKEMENKINYVYVNNQFQEDYKRVKERVNSLNEKMEYLKQLAKGEF